METFGIHRPWKWNFRPIIHVGIHRGTERQNDDTPTQLDSNYSYSTVIESLTRCHSTRTHWTSDKFPWRCEFPDMIHGGTVEPILRPGPVGKYSRITWQSDYSTLSGYELVGTCLNASVSWRLHAHSTVCFDLLIAYKTVGETVTHQ